MNLKEEGDKEVEAMQKTRLLFKMIQAKRKAKLILKRCLQRTIMVMD
jgi:hypothetical protein